MIKLLPKSLIIGPFGSLGKRLLVHMTLALLVSFVIMLFQVEFSSQMYLKVICLYLANDMVFTYGHMTIFYNLDLHFDWLKETKSRFFSGVIFHSAFSAFGFLLIQLVMMRLFFDFTVLQTWYWFLEMWTVPLGLTLVIIVFTTTIGFFQKWKNSMLEEQQIKNEMMAYKFESLKSQINPSFLFRGFDSLKKLINEDEKAAAKVIQNMSALYRSVLETKDMELVSLVEEMKLANLYFDLLKLSFGKLLKFSNQVNCNHQDRVVPMVIQNVIEMLLNMTHQMVDIEFKLDREMQSLLIISDVKIGGQDTFNLDNLQKRYEFFTTQKIEIENLSNGTRISIPILTEEL